MRITAMVMRITAMVALASFGCGTASAQVADDDALSKVSSAIGKGYGEMCTLTAERAGPGAGYYPCIDVGPYRFVFEYGLVRGYVLPKGGKPFPIAEGKDGRLEFTVTGPWTSDMGRRVSDWYADEVEGGRARREGDEAESKRRQDAEAAVRGFGQADPAPGSTRDADVTARDPGVAPAGANPQAYPPAPPIPPYGGAEARTDAAPGSYAPSPAEPPEPLPPGARLLAPGVVERAPGSR